MTSTHRRVLLRGGRLLSPERADATAMLTSGSGIAWIGSDAEASAHVDEADVVVDLDGRLVTPGFVDAHVHVVRTGLALESLDLSSTSSHARALDEISRYAATHDGAVLFAHGWDETKWSDGRPLTGAEIDRAVGSRVAYVSRVDSHSAVVSSALIAHDESITRCEGWRGDGVVEREAHHAARGVTDTLWTSSDRRRAALVALRRAARLGIVAVHDANAPHISPFDDLDVIEALRAEHALPEVASYWGAHVGGEHADDPRVCGFAGDLCIDGAIGSRTAALNAAYSDAGTSGHLYLDEVGVCEHVVWCTERGLQAGFHVIGDRGLDAATAGFQLAADKLGVEAVVAARHRLEHVEMPSPTAIALFARLNVVASVQPAFDAAWGAAGELYEQRLGPARSMPMNPFASMRRAGVQLAFGSDSPVTPLDPWGGVRAAVSHHNPDERLSVAAAFSAHTQGGHRARRDESAGLLTTGSRASYAVWDVRVGAGEESGGLLSELDLASGGPTCLRTVVAGATAFDAEETP
jgi:predicted amidohydrolase YtcJ